MKNEKAKKNLAALLEQLKINDMALYLLNWKYKQNYIRIINYHEVTSNGNFEEHLKWFKQSYQNCTYKKMEEFLAGKAVFDKKPGLIITFDDGFDNNYTIAKPLLEKYGFTGWFYVSAGLLGTTGYMTYSNLRQLLNNHHMIGCHTWSHHRMNVSDTSETLTQEIVQSRQKLSDMLDIDIDIFCWVGGEMDTYTKKAEHYIESSGYHYSMMTLSLPVTVETDHFHLQRTNIQEYWPLALVKFQLCGFMDILYYKKREEINKRTTL